MTERRGLTRTSHYSRWKNMVRRCHVPTTPNYPSYGGRGIYVCDRWRKSFTAFVDDMGLCPDGMSLERIDNDGPYSPENCRWATREEQCLNTRRSKRVRILGREMPLRDACKLLGLEYRTVHTRIMNGLSPEDAIKKPKGKHYVRRVREMQAAQPVTA